MASLSADALAIGGRRRQIPWAERYVNILGPLVMILALCLVMAFADARFFRLQNIMIILQDASIFMVLAMGMTLVITGRGIDLSIGSIATLSAVIMAMLIKDAGINVFVGMAVAILVGIACGWVNGFVITKLRVPDLIATLSTDLVFRGIALVLAAGVVLARFPDPLIWIGRGRLFDLLPVAAVVGLIAIAVGCVLYRHTSLGRYAVAIGGNTEAAVLTGIDVHRHKIYQYMLLGGLAGLAGILLTGRLNAIQATAGMGLTLHTIAAVVVGGTSLFGGRGSMAGTLVGVLLLSMVVNALVMLRLDFFWQQVAAGLIIITSVAFYAALQDQSKGGLSGLFRRARSGRHQGEHP